jgi:hypothetical protein
VLLLAVAAVAAAQDFTQRGFVETGVTLFPETAPNDGSHAVGEGLARYEASYKLVPGLRFAGAIDARFDTHLQTDRDLALSWWDRERLRPALEVRRASVLYSRGKLTFEAGKQFVRWGKADILNPTDRFAPRDFLNVIETDFLGITAARLTYGSQENSIDVVFAPRLTPSRVPLLDQRWAPLPAGLPVTELPPDIPNRAQFGARWNHVGRIAEYSLSVFDGSDTLPLYRGRFDPFPPRLEAQRFYPQLRMYGADAAMPAGPVTVKAEAGYFTSSTPASDEYALWVLQLERQSGEWSFVGGYAGQVITAHGTAPAFSPVRGFTRSFLARAGYTIDVNRSVEMEGVVRQNGRGVWLRAAYSQAFGQHWRATAGLAWIHGDAFDFIGQYHRNSYGILVLRYSF